LGGSEESGEPRSQVKNDIKGKIESMNRNDSGRGVYPVEYLPALDFHDT